MSSESNASPEDSSQSGNTSSSLDEIGPPGLSKRQRNAVVVLAAIAAILVGSVLATVAYGVTNSAASSSESPDGTVAVISIEGPIASPIGENLERQLRYVRQNDSIQAVVLKMDTPGGAPAPTERMYMAIKRTQQEMPVITSVQGLSASAGYYMMAPSEKIYVLPSSYVGSVGLAASAPQTPPPIRGPSGPDKRGLNTIEQWESLETIKNNFLNTVMEERGDEIQLPREKIAYASIYPGVEAVENGFADEIGSLDDAISDAADRANLESYDVSNRNVTPNIFPFMLQTDQGIVVVYDENPSYADVERLQYGLVYKPAVPHIDTVKEVSTQEIQSTVDKTDEEDTQSGGDSR